MRITSEWLSVTALLLLLTAASALWDTFQRIDHAWYDAASALWQRPAPEDVVIVAIDDDSIAQVGRWPWRRGIHATLVERLTRDGARSVGLDVLFTEADAADPAGDRALEQAIRRNGRVVLPLAEVIAPLRRVEALRPVPALAAAARALGYTNSEVDADGQLRRIVPAQRIGSALHRHFALATWEVARGDAAPSAPAAGMERRLYIAYAGPEGHFRHVSYADVLRGEVPEGFFRDRIVLVGATAAGLGDTHSTPSVRGNRQMSGVEIYANALDALRRPILIERLAPSATAAIAGLTVLTLMLGLRRASPRGGLWLSLCAALATLALSAALLRSGQWWYAPSAALLGCVLAYPLWSWRRLEATQALLDHELDRLAQEPAFFAAATPLPASPDPWQRRMQAVREASEVRRSARRFIGAALDSLPVGVLVADAKQHVVLANRRAFDLLGTEQQPVLGEALAAALGGLRLPPQLSLRELLDSAHGSILPRQVEVARDGDHPLLLGVAATDDEAHHASGIVACLSDVAELRRAQHLREQTMRFLSHDLRSPLMSIISMIDVMKDPEGQDIFDLDKIQQTARRALNLADDVMRLARAEALDPQRFRGVDLAVLGSQAAEEVAPLGRDRAIAVDFVTVLSPGEATCMGDGDLLRRALINLLNNAVAHSPDKGRVTLSLREETSEWVLTVEDQGPGIPAERLPGLFSPYSGTRARGREGTGLGLVIVKTVVERHGGTLAVDSRPGQGTRFVIRLDRPSRPVRDDDME